MKPPIPYFGGKQTLAPTIADLLPPHRHYVEPYAGSLAVLLAKPPSAHETVNDLDGDIVNFWRMLRESPLELARVCALTPHSRAEWDEIRDWINDPHRVDVGDLERARRLWVALSQSRSGRLRRSGWRHYVDPGAVGTPFPSYLDGYVDRMAAAAERLHAVTLECRPALELIAKYGAHRDVLLYVDPPYLGSTRGGDNAYRFEMRAEAEHRELAEALRSAKATVVLSGYPSPLYDDDLYRDWDRRTFAASTGQGGTWANRTEVLWSNRTLAFQPTLFESGATT